MAAKLKLAKAIYNSARLREESYDHVRANIAASHDTDMRCIDFSQFYNVTLLDACKQADAELYHPVYFLLRDNWNSALDWANEIINQLKSN